MEEKIITKVPFINPFRPGAGHIPPYLAGRDMEKKEFQKLLEQEIILHNMILTGLRGVGKTVLLEALRPIAINNKWGWVGTDLSESSSVSEEIMAIRLITDLSVMTSNFAVKKDELSSIGFVPQKSVHEYRFNYENLMNIYHATPGIVSDKLKNVLEIVWKSLKGLSGLRGIIFSYDEAQTMADNPNKQQYPLSLLLDVFQSIQKKEIPFMLILTGLPTLFPKLVETRTYSERMFRVITLGKLSEPDSRDAIRKPINDSKCLVTFDDNSVNRIIKESGGYPYFIQFICREVFDIFLQQHSRGQTPSVPINEITRKLDTDFFSGRWSKATDRQRELLLTIAKLNSHEDEFTVQEIVEKSKELNNNFGSSHVNQMLSTLVDMGLIYKNRHGRYSVAVPLLGRFILRQSEESRS